MAPFRISTRFAPLLAQSNEREVPIEQGQTGIGESVRLCFEELREPLYRYLHSAGASAADAEDIAQESLIRLYRQLHQGAQIREVRPWVFHVARNLLIDEKRKWNRRVSLQTDWQTQSRVEGRADPALNPEERAAQRQRLDRLYASVEELTELQRECLSLRAEGLRYGEIPSLLDLRLSTVSDAVHRAVLNLRRRLE